MTKIAQTNGRTLITLDNTSEAAEKNNLTNGGENNVDDSFELKTYSYLDLIRHKSIAKHLAALTYCWLAASIVSFGLYFNLGAVAGNIYMNTFMIGLFKGATGCLPYVLDRWMGRKPILIVSVVVTCVSCWSAAIFYLTHSSWAKLSWLTTLFTIVGTSAIDPMWKVNHLYSTELFPTVVRNMARAVCNVGSRLGSLIGPQVAYSSQVYFPSSFIIYGCVGLIHIFVAGFCLPETKGRPLIDRMPAKDDKIARQLHILRIDC